jgi:thiol-disulfide isomerase/thioredoxin
MMRLAQTKSGQRLAEYQNEYNRSSERNNELVKANIIANKNDLATLMFIDVFPADQNAELHETVVTALYAHYPENLIVKSKHDALQAPSTKIGSMAPDLAFSSPDGKILKLSDLKGKVVLLDFWASWCRPCRMENPNVVANSKKYHDQGFEVYSVSLDKDKNSWIKAIADDHLTWPNHVSDLKFWSSEAAAVYGVRSIPETYLIDRSGRIVAKNLRGEALAPALEKLLNN